MPARAVAGTSRASRPQRTMNRMTRGEFDGVRRISKLLDDGAKPPMRQFAPKTSEGRPRRPARALSSPFLSVERDGEIRRADDPDATRVRPRRPAEFRAPS